MNLEEEEEAEEKEEGCELKRENVLNDEDNKSHSPRVQSSCVGERFKGGVAQDGPARWMGDGGREAARRRGGCQRCQFLRVQWPKMKRKADTERCSRLRTTIE